MKIIDRIKAKFKSPIPKQDNLPSFIMTSTLRHNAEGLEASYGKRQFIDRIRAAADIIDELETALLAISFSTTDPQARELASDALDRLSIMRK